MEDAMAPRPPNDLLDAFIADGNTLYGPRPTKYSGVFDLVWFGRGAVLELGEGVSFAAAKLVYSPGGGSLSIERGATIKGRLEVGGGGHLRIGENSFLNRPCDIRAGEGARVDIGTGCLFSNVKVMTSDMHSVLDVGTGKRTNPAAGIVIEDNVWIAEDVKVAKGVRIGTGSIIAAGSLVTRSIAPLSLAGGRPARVLRTGVWWTRALAPMPALPAPAFAPGDIPLDKAVLDLLIARKEFALVEKVVFTAQAAAENGADLKTTAATTALPVFARWALVQAQMARGSFDPKLRAELDQGLAAILAEMPDHAEARSLRGRLAAGKI
jgi:acetyltransferase-like isoleucine patch superfamily enzyme